MTITVDTTEFLDLFAAEVARINDLDDDEVTVTLDSEIVNDLDIDSLGVLEIVLRLSAHYDVPIAEEDVRDVVRVRDFVPLVENSADSVARTSAASTA